MFSGYSRAHCAKSSLLSKIFSLYPQLEFLLYRSTFIRPGVLQGNFQKSSFCLERVVCEATFKGTPFIFRELNEATFRDPPETKLLHRIPSQIKGGYLKIAMKNVNCFSARTSPTPVLGCLFHCYQSLYVLCFIYLRHTLLHLVAKRKSTDFKTNRNSWFDRSRFCKTSKDKESHWFIYSKVLFILYIYFTFYIFIH